MKTMKTYLFAMLALLVVCGTASAQITNNASADASTIYTGLAAPFNAALAIKIGFLAITMIIGFILMALRRR